MTKYEDGRVYTSPYTTQTYKAGTNQTPTADDVDAGMKRYEERTGSKRLPKITDTAEYEKAVAVMGFERTLAPTWVVWSQRIFWLNLVLFLFNMIPAYPLDGEQLLQSLMWARTDHRRGVVVAAYTGFAVAVIFLIVSITANERGIPRPRAVHAVLASLKLMQLDMEEGRSATSPPQVHELGTGTTSRNRGRSAELLQAVVGRPQGAQLARELEARQKEDERVDQLLEKIARSGKGADRRGAAVPRTRQRLPAEYVVRCDFGFYPEGVVFQQVSQGAAASQSTLGCGIQPLRGTEKDENDVEPHHPANAFGFRDYLPSLMLGAEEVLRRARESVPILRLHPDRHARVRIARRSSRQGRRRIR